MSAEYIPVNTLIDMFLVHQRSNELEWCIQLLGVVDERLIATLFLDWCGNVRPLLGHDEPNNKC